MTAQAIEIASAMAHSSGWRGATIPVRQLPNSEYTSGNQSTLRNKAEVIPTLEHMFNQWLPVLAGLVGTAVGFYLKERK